MSRGTNWSGYPLSLQPNGGYIGIGTISPSEKLIVAEPNALPRIGILKTGVVTWYMGGDKSESNSWNLSFNTQSPLITATVGNRIGIGTTLPDQKLTVKGTVHAEEIVVDLNVPGPDYVFASDYKLPSLDQTKTFINKNKHLQGIPSAEQMQKEGISLGEMNMLLLKKVEELTLHLIAQKEENQNQTLRLKKLENTVSNLIKSNNHK